VVSFWSDAAPARGGRRFLLRQRERRGGAPCSPGASLAVALESAAGEADAKRCTALIRARYAEVERALRAAMWS
jgi:hypothetical protein